MYNRGVGLGRPEENIERKYFLGPKPAIYKKGNRVRLKRGTSFEFTWRDKLIKMVKKY